MSNPFDGYNAWENAQYDRVREMGRSVREISRESLGLDRGLPPLKLPSFTIPESCKSAEVKSANDRAMKELERRRLYREG